MAGSGKDRIWPVDYVSRNDSGGSRLAWDGGSNRGRYWKSFRGTAIIQSHLSCDFGLSIKFSFNLN